MLKCLQVAFYISLKKLTWHLQNAWLEFYLIAYKIQEIDNERCWFMGKNLPYDNLVVI